MKSFINEEVFSLHVLASGIIDINSLSIQNPYNAYTLSKQMHSGIFSANLC